MYPNLKAFCLSLINNEHQRHFNTRFHIMNIYWSQFIEKIHFARKNSPLLTILEGAGELGLAVEKEEALQDCFSVQKFYIPIRNVFYSEYLLIFTLI